MSRLATAPVEARAEVRRLAHGLRGSGGMYGFPEITESARRAEDCPDGDLPAVAGRLLEVLRGLAMTREGQQRTVLLVDDDPDIVDLLAAMLSSRDWEITSVGTLAEVPAVLARREVGLILLDLLLPDGDGRDLLRQLKRDRRTAHLPVIVLSARLGPATRAECRRLGADAYFEKPFDVHALRTTVQGALEGKPRGAASGAEAAPEVPPAPGRGNRKILFAEDDELIASVVRHRLEREGFEIQHFTDGLLALEAAKVETPALLILDLKLPGMDGYEILQRLRELPAYRGVPILILTALEGEGNLVRAFDLGATDYVVKPFSPAELVARVKRLTT
jgi:DNA-binding response OmpR family regulator